ncbi:phosphatase 2C-domain-containing protein [Pilaira anomala]|nr:phosphatase 2C-domain-containing protein [Pilaira anomala]
MGNMTRVLNVNLDQNFGSMDGIINPEYRNPSRQRTSISNQGITGDPISENWEAPDSWAVQPADEMLDDVQTPNLNKDQKNDYFPVVENENWSVPTKNYCIRIFRPDGTFGTLIVPLDTTAHELIQRLAGKFFLHDLSKYRLTLIVHNLERIIQLHEHPIQIQKTLLEQIGYTDQDHIEDVGREDNSYLFRFTFGHNVTQPAIEEEEFGTYRRVDLQGRNLLTIPIVLYQFAARINSLDLSKNLMMEIPVDFVQMCKNLKQLWLANNDYNTLPTSIRHIPNLEHLNISGNHIKDLETAGLEELVTLRTLRAYNNRLTTLPSSFDTFRQLSILFISNNSFTKFPTVICEITSLNYLDISFNKITCFPDEICNLTQLIGLYAIANRLTGRLPPGFSKLEKLQELDVRQNQITDLDELYLLPKLEVISVDYNAISVVSYNFRNLRQLKMTKNHLTQFLLNPSHLSETKGFPCTLTDLNLSNCKLTSLAEDLFQTALSLETLILDNNTLSQLPTSIGCCIKLVRLSVQGNNLETLPSEISNLSELKILDAQKNNMKSLPKEIWLCASLQTLNCSSNLLETFPQPPPSPSPPQPTTTQISESKSIPTPISESLPVHPTTSVTTPPLPSPPPPPPAAAAAASSVSENEQRITSTLLSSGFHPPPNFNPPSFFSSPRNHPPPLSLSLQKLYLGDNRFTDDIWSPLSLFLELRTLNLCFNDLYEIPVEGLCHHLLYELYLSGNHLASLPADDIERLSYLRVLAVNGNKLQTLPAEISKLRKLLVLDVGNNVLKYNISNWPYDWNWNWNLGLKYLNLSGNKRLEIKKTLLPELHNPKEKNLSDFSALVRLRMLGLMDVTIVGVSTPDESEDRRVRTSPSEVNGMSYGVADWLGPSDHLATWDLVLPRFRNRDDECLLGLFDGRKLKKAGRKLTRFLNDHLTSQFTHELDKNKNDDTIVSALRRTFLALEKEFGSMDTEEEKELGASALICYISGTKLYVANVGDVLAVLSRNNGQAHEITQKHIPLNPSEISRIRAAGGFVSNSGLLNDELNVSRSFGYYHLIPVVNPNPFISTINLAENDEFVIMASRGLWDRISYQTAVDIARTEKDDLMIAAQKLRDFAITYGADDNIMVMIIGVGDLFDKRDKRLRNMRAVGGSRAGLDASIMDDGLSISKNKRRQKDEGPGDSTLARLDREVPPPTNQVALVFTDIKSSTLLWDTQPEAMRSAIKIHDAVMRRTLRSVGGYEVKTEGDAFMVCFQDTISALLWCFTVQLQLLEADWPAGILETGEGREIEKDNVTIYRGLSVRMGIHLGTPVFERNPITKRMDYFGPVVNKASRICNAADGGQICVSSDVIDALRKMPGVFGKDEDEDSSVQSDTHHAHPHSISRDIQQIKRLGFHVVEMGERRLKGLETPEMLSLVYPKQLSGRMEKNDELSPAAPPPSILTTPTPQMEAPSELSDLYGGESVSEQHQHMRQTRRIDPSYVVNLSNLAIRLESITTGAVLNRNTTEGDLYTRTNTPSGLVGLADLDAGAGNSNYAQAFNQRMKDVASDEELLMLIENFVTRIENAASSLYLQKLGNFAGVLEKLGEAIELDPSHILRALQIYSEVSGLTKKPSGL